MRQASLQTRSKSPPGPGPDRLRPYVQRQPAVSSSSTSPRGQGPGMYVAEAIPIKSGRPVRPFPSGSSFSNPSSGQSRVSGVSQAERLIRSAGIITSRSSVGHAPRTSVGGGGTATGTSSFNGNSQSDTEDRPEPRFPISPRRISGELTQPATSPSNSNPIIPSNRRNIREVRDREQGTGVGSTERVSSNLFSLTGSKGRRENLGGGVIPLAVATTSTAITRPRDREFPHHLHDHQEDIRRHESSRSPRFPHSSGFSSPEPESNSTTRSPRVISKLLGPSGTTSTAGGVSVSTSSSNESPRGEGNRLVVKRRRDGDLHDLEDNTPPGLISFFDGIRSATGVGGGIGMGRGRGKGMPPLRSFDEFDRHGPASPNNINNNTNHSHKIPRNDTEDLHSRFRKEFEYYPSRQNGTARIGQKATPTTASERHRDIHERYGVPNKGSGVNSYGRSIGAYNRGSEEKTPTVNPAKSKLIPPPPHSFRNTSVSSSSSHPPHSNTNTNTNAKLINRAGIRRPPTSGSSSVKGGAHLIEESRPDNPPLNSSVSSRKELSEIDMREGTNTTTDLRTSKAKLSETPDLKATVPHNNTNHSNNTSTRNSGGAGPGNPNPSPKFGPRDSNSMDDQSSPVVRGTGNNNDSPTTGSNECNSVSDTEMDDNEDESNSTSEQVDINNNMSCTANEDLKASSEKKCPKCKVLSNSQVKHVNKIKTLQKNSTNMECLIRQKRELVEQLQQQVKILMRENQSLAKLVVNNEKTAGAISSPNLTNNGKSSTGLGFPITGKSSTSPVIPINLTLSEGDCLANPGIHRKTISNPSFLSSIHSLNPHRKVAMSPEHLKEAEDKITSLTDTCDKLRNDLRTAKSEQDKMQKFLGDLLYTLNGRGFEAITDSEGNVVDLNRCKGDTYLELKGRDQRQKTPVRRVGGNDCMLKAVIGSQEKMIQNLIAQLEAQQRDLLIGDKLSSRDREGMGEGSRTAVLENEFLQLMTLLETTCQRCPDVFIALREQHQLDLGKDMGKLNSPRMLNSQAGIVQKILERCEHLVLARYPTPPLPAPIPSYTPARKCMSREARDAREARRKLGKEYPSSKRHLEEYSKPGRPSRESRRLRSSGAEEFPSRTLSQPIIPAEFTQSEDSPGRFGSGSGTLDNQNQNHQHEHQGSYSDPEGHGNGAEVGGPRRRQSYTDMKPFGTANGNNPRVSDPTNVSFGSGSIESYCREGRICPYCGITFEPGDMTSEEIHEHLTSHLFQSDGP